jgi:hypothetical protein
VKNKMKGDGAGGGARTAGRDAARVSRMDLDPVWLGEGIRGGGSGWLGGPGTLTGSMPPACSLPGRRGKRLSWLLAHGRKEGKSLG